MRNALTICYVLVAAAILSEGVLRLFDPIGIAYYFETDRYFRRMVPDPDFGYIHAPNQRVTLQGVQVAINRVGLRWAEFDEIKKSGTRRLYILGDSMVFGWGAPQDSVFPVILQGSLRRASPTWEVIAAGVGSWNTRNEVEYFKKHGIALRPDVVLLFIVSNDIDPSTRGRTSVPPSELFAPTNARPWSDRFRERVWLASVRRSYLLATIQHHAISRSVGDLLVTRYAADSPAVEDARRALEELSAICSEVEAPFVAVLYGDRSSALGVAFLDRYSALLNSLGITYSEIPRVGSNPEFRNSLVDGHPNGRGHVVIADSLRRVLAPYLDNRDTVSAIDR